MEKSIKLKLKKESWNMLLSCTETIHKKDKEFSAIHGYLYSQLKMCISQDKTDIDDIIDPAQIDLFKEETKL